MIDDDWSAASFGMKKDEEPPKHEGLTTNDTPGKLVPHKKSALVSKDRPQPPPSVNDCPGGICDWAD